MEYAIKEISPWYFSNVSVYFLDVRVFEGCEFLKMFEEANLKNSINDTSGEIYLTLARIFSANLKYTYRIIILEVWKHHISLSLEEFVEIYNLPCTGSPCNESNKGEDFIVTVSNSFLLDPNASVLSPFLMGNVYPNIRLIYTHSFPL